MKSSQYLIMAIGCINTIIMITQFIRRDFPNGLLFLGYAISSVGAFLQIK